MVFGGPQRAFLLAIMVLSSSVLPPLIRVFLLTPKVSHQKMEDPMFELYMIQAEHDSDEQLQESFFQQPLLLAKSFQAARLLGATRANHVSASLFQPDGQLQSGNLIGVSNRKEAEDTLKIVQKELKGRAKVQLIPIATTPSLLQSTGFLPGDFAQWLLAFKLKRAARKYAQQHHLPLDDKTVVQLQASFSNVLPRQFSQNKRKSSQQLDMGYFWFLPESKEEPHEEDQDISKETENQVEIEEEDHPTGTDEF